MRLISYSRTTMAVATALMLTSLAGLTACGTDDKSGDDTGSQATAAGFPVSVEHKYGTTEIKAEPKRVVVVGLTEQDALLALGVVPVATTEWFGEHPGAIWPWARDELGGATPPEVLTNTDGIPFEKVATLRPDLIVGIYSALTQEDYDTLSKIAPTLAQPTDAFDYGASWQDVTRMVGQAVGRADRADQLVSEVEAKFAKAKADNPQFAGATGLVATIYEGNYVYGPQDSRGRFLTDLGFTLPDGLEQVTGQEFGANLSRERTDLLDTDVLIWQVDAYDTDKASIQADPLYSALKVKAEGRDIFLENEEPVGAALTFVTVLSLPDLLDGLVPQLVAAIDGNPTTPVQRTTQ